MSFHRFDKSAFDMFAGMTIRTPPAVANETLQRWIEKFIRRLKEARSEDAKQETQSDRDTLMLERTFREISQMPVSENIFLLLGQVIQTYKK